MSETASGINVYPTKQEILSNLYVPTEAERHEIIKWRALWYERGTAVAYERPSRPGVDEEDDEWFAEDHEFRLYCPGWTRQPAHRKWTALKELVVILCTLHGVSLPAIIVDDGEWRYYTERQALHGNYQSPSIISLLHELGHHIYGEKELDACRFSVGIFKACFPGAYRSLRWEGHRLVR